MAMMMRKRIPSFKKIAKYAIIFAIAEFTVGVIIGIVSVYMRGGAP